MLENEIKEKEKRIRNLLSSLGYESVLLTRRENFSWFTCGKRAVVSYITEDSPVYLLITPTKKYAIGFNMDVPRTMQEEIYNQSFEPVSLPTYDINSSPIGFAKTKVEAAKDLAIGRLAADLELEGIDGISSQIINAHLPFTNEEMERYREVGKEGMQILHDLALWVEPGMTEREIVAKMWEEYVKKDFDCNCMFATADERIKKFRHGVPTFKKVKNAVLLAPAVYKYGLNITLTRMVYFKEPPEDIRRRMDSVMALQASVVSWTKIGTKLSEILNRIMALFTELGYPEERNRHFHGGPQGYHVSYPERNLDPGETVGSNMAFGWYLCITGTKSEETLLVDNNGTHIATFDPDYPYKEIETNNMKIKINDILVRK